MSLQRGLHPMIGTVLIPIGVLGTVTVALQIDPRFLLEQFLRIGEIRFPGLPLVLLLSAFAVLNTFRAHFHPRVPDAVAWFTIFLAGVFLVWMFQGLHRAAGIVCTAPICVTAQEAWAIDGTLRFVPPENGADTKNHPPSDAVIDQGYRSALYFSIVTFTTLGYGDFQPLPSMQVYTAGQAVFGYVYLGLLVGALIHRSTERAARVTLQDRVRRRKAYRKRTMHRSNRRLSNNPISQFFKYTIYLAEPRPPRPHFPVKQD